jgi:SAM-dependent methyltransferase
MFPFSGRTNQYHYFDRQLGSPGWRKKTVLDFGGNVGGFLAGAGPEVRHEDYWCLDLSRPALEKGRADFPRAQFVFYDRYNSRNNPMGVPDLPVPDLGVRFDFVLAFSVFTHTSRDEMLTTIDQLRRLLRPGGVIAFTFFDPLFDPLKDSGFDLSQAREDARSGPNILHRLEVKGDEFAGVDSARALAAAQTARWMTLASGTLFVEPDDGPAPDSLPEWSSFIQYYQPGYLKTLFPDADVRPPISPERQHCCVLHGGGAG